MASGPILLDVLLRERQWHRYGIFRARYDEAASSIDRELVGTCPSRAQLHRWLSGQLKGLPYVDHCRVLEVLFPGWTAAQLFQSGPAEGTERPVSAETAVATRPGVDPPAADRLGDERLGGVLNDAVPMGTPIAIRPYVERAFTRDHVTIAFFGFSGETLHGVIQEPLDKIRVGQLKPLSLDIRLLLPDPSIPMAVPCRTEDMADDPSFRQRTARIMQRHATAIVDSVQELRDLGMVKHASVRIRVHGCPPLCKLYILNDDEVFFGFYPIRPHAVTIGDATHEVFDLMGKEASVFRHTDAEYIGQARQWFDSVWQTIGREHIP
jgi:hypothetical protein